MTLWTLGMGTSSSLVATAIVYWIIEHNLVHALAIGGTGVIVFILTLIFAKRPPAQPTVHQENKQEFKPHTEFHQPISVVVGGNAAAPAPAPEKKSEPRCNIECTGVGQSLARLTPLVTAPFATAAFENHYIKGQQLRIPTVRARLVFRDPQGTTFADLSNVPWAPSQDIYATLRANTPQHLILFGLANGHLFARTVEPIGIRIGRQHGRTDIRQIPLTGGVSTVEVQLLTEAELLYRVVLVFRDGNDNTLPQFVGFGPVD